MVFESHPDANQLSALLEGSLPEQARHELLEHFADCGRCRRWLACAQAAQPHLPAPAPALRVLHYGWETPLATAASVCVLAALIWMALPRPVAAPSNPSSGVARTPQAAPLAHVTALASGAVAAPHRPRLGEQRRLALPTPAAAVGAPETPLRLPGLAAAPAPTEIQPSIDFAPLMTGFLDQPPVTRQRSQLAAFTTTVAAAPHAPAATAPTLGLGGFGTGFQSGGLSGPMAPVLANTLGWAISRSGQVLRSVGTDLWAAVPLVPGVHIHALSTTDKAIWAGGQVDQLFVSRDGGKNWKRVDLPSVANAQVPISSIVFGDEQHGTVTTADGHTWTTADGGATWSFAH